MKNGLLGAVVLALAVVGCGPIYDTTYEMIPPSDGHGRILERVPDKLHARTPLYIGSTLDVEAVEKIYARHAGR